MSRQPISRRERPAKSPLSRDAVVAAALEILQREGLKKVTMRSIAAALETGPASLYVYVRDTDELHARVLDALLVDLPAPKPSRRWRADLGAVTEAYLLVLMRYPEVARLATTAHFMGPNALRLLDTVAGLLLRAGASTRTAAWGVDLVLGYAVAIAVEHSGRDHGDEADDLQHMVATLDATTHPHLAKLGNALISGEGIERFRWGLDTLVDGLLAKTASLRD